MIIKRIEDPKETGYAVGWAHLENLEDTGYSIIKTADLEALEKLVYIAFQELRSEGGRYPPENFQEVNDLFDITVDIDDENVMGRLKKLFEQETTGQ